MDGPRILPPPKDASATSRMLVLVSIVVVIAGLYFGRRVLIPLALAVVLAFLLTPVVTLLEKCRLGRVASVLVVLVMAVVLLGAISWGVTNQLVEILVHLPDYRANIHNKIEAIRRGRNVGLSKATATVDVLNKELSAASDTASNKKGGREPIAVQLAAPPRSAAEYLREAVGPLTGILETSGVTVIFTLFILVKREDLRNRMFRLAGSHQLSVMTQALDEASQRLSRYLVLQFVVNAGYGLLFGLGVYFIGIPHPLLWGLLASLLRFVPYVGTPFAAAFPMGLALAIFPGWSQLGLTFALFVLLELTIANLVEPWLYGSHTGVSSLAILVAAIFWGMLWGPVGLLLSTPLTVCLILMGRYVPQLSFLEVLLGDEPVLSPQAHFYQRLLALDEVEAREIADNYLKENSIGDLYDSVLIPALSLAEKDRHMNVLDESRTTFIHQTTRELIEELYESYQTVPNAGGDESAASPLAIQPASRLRIVCIPARDEADEIVGMMVMQLLRRAGYDADALPIGAVSTMVEQVDRLGAQVICISALPPFATSQAKSLCKRLRHQCPEAKIVIGLWEFPGGVTKAQERMGNSCANVIATSLAQVTSLIGVESVLAC